MRKHIALFLTSALIAGTTFGTGYLTVTPGDHVKSVTVVWYSRTWDWQTNVCDQVTQLEGCDWDFHDTFEIKDMVADVGYNVSGYMIIDHDISYNWSYTNVYDVTSGSYKVVDAYSSVQLLPLAVLATNSIAYVLNGGTNASDAPTSYTIESPDVALPSNGVTRTGYAFAGWTTNEFGDVVTTIPAGSTGDMTFYAKWTPNVYSVTLNLKGGWITWSGSEQQITDSPFVTNYTYGVGLTLPSFGKSGYLAGGWHTLEDGSDPTVSSIGTSEMGEKTFWANFTEKECKITLDNQGADVSGTMSVTVKYDGDFPEITCPEKTGYAFAGYFAQTGGHGAQYYKNDGTWRGNSWTNAADGTIYAYWLPNDYTVTFNPGDGGTGATSEMALKYGAETNLPTAVELGFSKEGYVFAGWTNGTDNVVFEDGQAVSNLVAEANAVVNMYAVWSKGHYYVEFNANGGEGTMETQKFTYDVPADLATNVFTRAGHDFAGWAWNSAATTNDIEFTDCQTVSNLVSDIDSTNTLYAVWTAERYTVVLDADSGLGGYFVDGDDTNEVKNVKVTYGAPYNLPEPTNKNSWMTFAGWKYIDGDTGEAKPLPELAPLYADGITNIVAQWADGLKVALNAEGTDFDYTTGGTNRSARVDLHVSWTPATIDGANVGQSGDLPANVNDSYTYVRTILPGSGILTFNWRIHAPEGFWFRPDDEESRFMGNSLTFVNATNGSELAARLFSGDDYGSQAWVDTDWQTVAFTNNMETSLPVEWRFEYLNGKTGGGTGWVDNVTWTPITLPVASNDLVLAQVEVDCSDVAYNGSAHEPDVVSVMLDGKPLTKDTDYTLAYSDNLNVGTATITLTGINDFIGTYVTNFTITAKELESAMVGQVADTNYTGEAIQPEPTVSDADRGVILAKDADYTLSWGENVNAGSGSVVVTGKGNYSGTVTNMFTIAQAENSWIVAPSIDGWTSGETASEPNMGEAKFGVATVAYGAMGASRPVEPGSYTATFTVAETANYTGLSTNVQFTVGSSEPEPKPLDGKFDDLPVTVASDGANGWIVTLTNDIAAADLPIELPGGLGQVTIDLNGHVLSDVDGQPAIRVAEGASGTEVTFLPVQNDWITAPSIADWTSGETPSVPAGEAKFGEVVVTYGESGTTPPDAPGDYTATFAVAGTIYYTGLTNEVAFTVKSNEPEPFHIPGEGTVTIPRTWRTGQKVTWKAKAAKGSVFARWEGTLVDSLNLTKNERRNPSLAFVVPEGFATNMVTAVFLPIDDDGLYTLGITQTEFELKEAVSDVCVTDDSQSYVTASASGLPTGLKFDAKKMCITGTPTKSGVYWVQVKAKNASGYQWAENVKVTVSGDGKEAKEPKLTRTAYYPFTVICATEGGTVSGTGVYAEGKKVTIKATAAKGHVFAGWYETAAEAQSGGHAGRVTLAASMSVVVPEMRYVFAKFVTAEEDKDSIELEVDGVEMTAGAGRPPYQTNIWAGVYMEWPVAASALSETKVKVTGLPAGLKFTDKPVTSKIGSGKTAVTVTNVPAYTIYGAPTAASKTTTDRKTGEVTVTPSAVKITVTTAGKSSQIYQIDTYVDALPAWAVGTFNGVVFDDGRDGARPSQEEESAQAARSTNGVVTLTIAANGKISGKLMESGKTWTLSATSFDEVTGPELGYLEELDTLVFHATVIGKNGKLIATNTIEVAAEDVAAAVAGQSPCRRGVVSGWTASEPSLEWSAWQNLWKTEPWKTAAKPFAKAPALVVDAGTRDACPYQGTITLKFAASGAVTASGKFVTGQNAKGKDIVYSASCSAVLVPAARLASVPDQGATGGTGVTGETDETFSILNSRFSIFLYFPPKAGKFDGYADEASLEWDGAVFSLVE